MSNDLATTGTGLSTDDDLTKTVRALRILNQYENDILEEGRILTLSKEVTRAGRQIMTDRHHAIANSLRGCGLAMATREKAAAAIAGMFRDGWPTYKMDNPKQVVAAYLNNLQDYPIWAVESVCAHAAKGLVMDLRPDFPPTAARLSQLCESKIADLKDERRKFLRVLSIKDIRATPMSNEDRAAAAGRYEQWKAENRRPDPISLEEQRQRDGATQRTLETTEQLILRENAARGMEPVRVEIGPKKILVSPFLLDSIKKFGAQDRQHKEHRRRNPAPDQNT